MDERRKEGYRNATNMDIHPKILIACSKCNTIKLIKYFPEHDSGKFEACWACSTSSKIEEWEIVQVIVD